jgi:hypothetical protein
MNPTKLPRDVFAAALPFIRGAWSEHENPLLPEEHLADPIAILSPDVAAGFLDLSPAEASQAGICPLWLWEDVQVPAETREAPKLDDEGIVVVDEKGHFVMGTEIVRPAAVVLGIRSRLAARASPPEPPTDEERLPPAEEEPPPPTEDCPPAAPQDPAADPGEVPAPT